MHRVFWLIVNGERIGVNVASQSELLSRIEKNFRIGKGFAVATLNLDHAVKLKDSAEFRHVYGQHEFVVADGNPVVWLSKLAKRAVSLVTGSDLVLPLARLAAQEKVPVALLGANEITLARASMRLREKVPGLSVVARLAPGQGFDPYGNEATDMIARLRASGARLTYLALGAERQEAFAIRCRESIPDMGLVSIGAGLDFIADSQFRAPLWMRRLMLEWLWRMFTDPKRLAWRYVRCACSLPGLVVSVLRNPQDGLVSGTNEGPAETALGTAGFWDAGRGPDVQEAPSDLPNQGTGT